MVIHGALLIDSLWYSCNVSLDGSFPILLTPLVQQLSSAAPRDIPPELEDELFSRNKYFFGDGFEDIKNALVIVVGLGGVGSHAAHMLVSQGGGPSICCCLQVPLCCTVYETSPRKHEHERGPRYRHLIQGGRCFHAQY